MNTNKSNKTPVMGRRPNLNASKNFNLNLITVIKNGLDRSIKDNNLKTNVTKQINFILDEWLKKNVKNYKGIKNE